MVMGWLDETPMSRGSLPLYSTAGGGLFPSKLVYVASPGWTL